MTADPAILYLNRKLKTCLSNETRALVALAISLRPQYPDADGPELFRLAHWQ